MAKKKGGSKKSKKQVALPENALPVNIQLVGTESEADVRIYISRTVHKEICKQTQKSLPKATGGLLIGDVIEENGKKNVVISAFIKEKYAECTDVTVKFTSESFVYMHEQMLDNYPDKNVVGWVFSQPGNGIMISQSVVFLHNTFFGGDKVLFVVDPVENEEGFCYTESDGLSLSKGYYLFDSAGQELSDSIGQGFFGRIMHRFFPKS